MDELTRTDRDDGADGPRGGMGTVDVRIELADLKAQLWNRTHERDDLRAACDVATARIAELEQELRIEQNLKAMLQVRIAELEAQLDNAMHNWGVSGQEYQARIAELEAELRLTQEELMLEQEDSARYR